jgi:hypothetical protein
MVKQTIKFVSSGWLCSGWPRNQEPEAQWGQETGTIKVSLNHALPISLCYSTHKVFKSHIKSSHVLPLMHVGLLEDSAYTNVQGSGKMAMCLLQVS